MWNNKHHVSSSILNEIFLYNLYNRFILAWHTDTNNRLQMPWWVARDRRGIHRSRLRRMAASHGSVKNAVCLQTAGDSSFKGNVANGSIQRMETKKNNFYCQNTAYLEAMDPSETRRFSKWDSSLDLKELPKQLPDCFTDEELWTSRGRSWNYFKYVFWWKIHYK